MTATISPLFTWRSAIADSGLPPMTRLVALTLSLHMSERGDSCMPSISLLESETGLGRSTVQRSLAKLEESGLLEVSRGTGRGHTNHYRAVVTEEHLDSFLAARPRLQERVSQIHPSAVKGVTGTVKGVSVTPEDVRGRRSTVEAKASTSKPRAKDELWDTLVDELGPCSNSIERGRRNKALAALRESGATPETIRRVAAAYRAEWPGIDLTAMALAANWSKFTVNGQSETGVERLRRAMAERGVE